MGSSYFSKRVHKLCRHCTGGRKRAKRPKTFRSEAAAKKWAQEQGIKDFSLANSRNTESKKKKIKVIIH